MRIKPIPSWPNYFVSDEGDVFSTWHGGWRKLSAHPYEGGYLKVHMSKDGRKRLVFVHKLVLLAFCSVQTTLALQTRHLDGNPKNNRLSNLAVGTAQDNTDDKVRHGRLALIRGACNGRSKFTEEQIIEAARRAASGERYKTIRADLGMSRVQLQRILSGELWGYLGVAIPTHERNRLAMLK